MKNTPVKMRKAKRFAICTFFLFFTFYFLSVSGCNKSLQMPPWGFDVPAISDINEVRAEAVRIVREGLADDNPLTRANAVEVIAATREIKLMPKVQRLLKDEFVPVRFAAALAVGDMEYRMGENRVAQLLKDKDENVRIAAAYALNKLGHSESFKILRRAIASDDKTVRANAALLLGKIGDKSQLKFLYWALRRKDSDDKVRFNAVQAIAMLGDERIYPKLWTMLISAYHDDRVIGIQSMGTLGTNEARNALITMLDDDVLEVRLAAAEQLGALGEGTGVPEVLDVFEKNLTAGLDRQDRERIYVRTALAIGRIGTASLTKFLPQLLADESKFVQLAAAKAVFQCRKAETARQ